VRVYGSTTTVTVAGDLDFAVAGQLSAVLHAVLVEEPEMVLLDLSAVSFIDGAGAAVVDSACQRARARSAHVTIIPGGEHVQRVFRLTGLDSTLPFAPSSQTILRTRFRTAGFPLTSASQAARPLRGDTCAQRPAGQSR